MDVLGRRDVLKSALASGGLAALGVAGGGQPARADHFHAPPGARILQPEEVPHFAAGLPIPGMHAPSPDAFVPGEGAEHGIAPEFDDDRYAYLKRNEVTLYECPMVELEQEVILGRRTRLWGYGGVVPGPTFVVKQHEPIVVRFRNDLPCETSVHWHGGHTPAHADGYPIFYVLPGRKRDYFYPNTLPVPSLGSEEPAFDETETPSTMWYHDHAEDITAHNVYHGLAGFYLNFDRREADLIADGVLPASVYNPFRDGFEHRTGAIPHTEAMRDIPIVLQDKVFYDAGGGRAELFFDQFEHDGFLGNVEVLNGKAFPTLEVDPAVYRFRFLNGSLSRFYDLRLSTGDTIWRIGKDSWLYPRPIPKDSIFISMANRADVIFDFSRHAGRTLYLENILDQEDGRGPGNGDTQFTRGNGFGTRPRKAQPTRLLQIKVRPFPAGRRGQYERDAAAMLEKMQSTELRPHRRIDESEAEVVRHFVFERRKGAWQINHRFFEARTANAAPRLFGTEKWILENKSGGWWHPVHIHLESHHQIRADAKVREGDEEFRSFPVPPEDAFKTDTTILGPNTRIEILMRFRTFPGPFVFHCHNLPHEDMRMMFAFDPRADGPFQGPIPIQSCFP